MVETVRRVIIDPNDSGLMANVVQSNTTPTKSWQVVLNSDWTDIWKNIPQDIDNESVWLLRRMVKLMESQSTVDIANRQRVTVDAMTPWMWVNFGIWVSLVGNWVTSAAPLLTTLYPLPVWEWPVEQRWRVMEDSHQAYQIWIRQHLSFT
jgi:hypothetical protein